MTQDLITGDVPNPDQTFKKRWPWLLFLILMILLSVVVFSPSCFGGMLLKKFGGPSGITASSVSGPVWAPHADGLKIKISGVDASVGSATLSIESVNLASKTVRIKVKASDVTIGLKLKELLEGGGSAGSGDTRPAWSVLVNKIELSNTKVVVNGKNASIPDGNFEVNTAPNGTIQIRGKTPSGELNADLIVSEKVKTERVTAKSTTSNIFTLNIDADAKVLKEYWEGVTAGRITGTYVFGDGPIKGDLQIKNAALVVPEAKFVSITAITGAMQHRGDQINLNLSGLGWQGPVLARGKIDLKAQQWQVSADAQPTLDGFARSLNTSGDGIFKLKVKAYGWQKVTVKAQGQGSGKFAGIAFKDADLNYNFLKDNSKPKPIRNNVVFKGKTFLVGTQAFSGNWFFNKGGTINLAGTFSQKPLKIDAIIDAKNVIGFKGSGLGGPAAGTFALSGAKLNAVLHPNYGAAKLTVALTGTPTNLKGVISDGNAGPFALKGLAYFDSKGLRADLNGIDVSLNKAFRGTWRAQNFSGAGISLTGAGGLDLTGGDVTGGLSATVTGLVDTLSGPVNLNYVRQQGIFKAGPNTLTWNKTQFRGQVHNLKVVGGIKVNGDVTLNTALEIFGKAKGVGNGFEVTATGQGKTVALRGLVGGSKGFKLSGSTSLKSPITVKAVIDGTQVKGQFVVANGLKFQIKTPNELAQGSINGQNWQATGRLNLAAFRPLLPAIPDLAGTLDLGLLGRSGQIRVNATGLGAQLGGTIDRVGNPFNANLTLKYIDAVANLRGQVYPSVNAAGMLSAQGQKLNVLVSGAYSALQARLMGQTTALNFSGVSLPAQAINLTANLTPSLSLRGTWGRLFADYNAKSGLVALSGQQNLTAFSMKGLVSGKATWGPTKSSAKNNVFQGHSDFTAQLDQYTLTAVGPWNALAVVATSKAGLKATGTVSLPTTSYTLKVVGPIPGNFGLKLTGNIKGIGDKPKGNLNILDNLDGKASVQVNNLNSIVIDAQQLHVSGQKINGNLALLNNVVNGKLQVGNLVTIKAVKNVLTAEAVLARHTLKATAQYKFPATLNQITGIVTGPYINTKVNGDLNRLVGTLQLQRQAFGSDSLQLAVPAQIFPLTLQPLKAIADIGGLVYQAGNWSGGVNINYGFANQKGYLTAIGQNQNLSIKPTGPIIGDLQVLPSLQGNLKTSLQPLNALVPANFQKELVWGQLLAQISPSSAKVFSQNTQYQNQPLALNASVDWKQGIKINGLLTHPKTRIPISYNDKDLEINHAQVDAKILHPLLKDIEGELKLNATIPNLKLDQASYQSQVDLRLNNISDLKLTGNIKGIGDKPKGNLNILDNLGGKASVQINNLNSIVIDAQQLHVSGQKINGNLALLHNIVNGKLQVGNLVTVKAVKNVLTAEAVLAGHTLKATAQYKFPATLNQITGIVTGPYINTKVNGDLNRLVGTLQLQRQAFGSDGLQLAVPAQIFPLTILPLKAIADIGGLVYQAGNWSGGVNINYGFANQKGYLTAIGQNQNLSIKPTGPIIGDLQVLPSLQGNLKTSLQPLNALVPANFQKELVWGQLLAQISPSSAKVFSQNTQYQNQPLALNASVDWKQGIKINGLLTHPKTRIPISYNGKDLEINHAQVDAKVLHPLLKDIEGELKLNATIPNLKLDQASYQSQVDLRLNNISDLKLTGNIKGIGDKPKGNLNILDNLGGKASVQINNLNSIVIDAQQLHVSGQKINGNLALLSNVVNGKLQVGNLVTVKAVKNVLTAEAVLAGHTLKATAQYKFPATLNQITGIVTGPYINTKVNGDLNRLVGTLQLQRQAFGSDSLQLAVPAQIFPLTILPLKVTADIGSLVYQAGNWSGGVNINYGFANQKGYLTAIGQNQNLSIKPTGPIIGDLQVLPSLQGNLKTSLQPLNALVPANFQKELVWGQLLAQISPSSAKVFSQNTQYQNQPLALSASVDWKQGIKINGLLTHPKTRIPISYNGKDLEIDNAQVDAKVLRPLLKDIEGQLKLSATVPYLNFSQAMGQSQINLTSQGQKAVGSVQLVNGQISANLTSNLVGANLQVKGLIYPNTNAQITYKQLAATLTGSANDQILLKASGKYQSKPLELTATFNKLLNIQAKAVKNDARTYISATGNYAGAIFNAQLLKENSQDLLDWQTKGKIIASDLKNLVNIDGTAKAELEGTLNKFNIFATGKALGIDFKAPLIYQNSKLNLKNGQFKLAQGSLTASGLVYPQVNVQAGAKITELLPGIYKLQALGPYNKLVVLASGDFDSSALGLQVAGSHIAAKLAGKNWRADLSGLPINGSLRGQLGANALGGLLDAQLNLNTQFISGPTKIDLKGQTGWNAKTGWLGDLLAQGQLASGPLKAQLQGAGAMNVLLTMGIGSQQASLKGTLPANLPFKPSGQFQLQTFDIASFWNKPNQLRLTGDVALGGASWSALRADFKGQLQDIQNELTGDLNLNYAAGNVQAKLIGPKIQAEGSLENGTYFASLNSASITLARLLPDTLKINELTFSGRSNIQGTLKEGLQQVSLTNITLKGQQQQVGPFSLYGNAQYEPKLYKPKLYKPKLYDSKLDPKLDEIAGLSAQLSGSLRGGLLKATGQLPEGLKITAQKVPTAYPNAVSVGGQEINADLLLRGDITNPLIEGTLTSQDKLADAYAIVSGTLRDPLANLRLILKGANSGILYAEASSLDLTAGTLKAKVYGTVKNANNEAKINLSGVWPKLAGQVTATIPALKEPLKLTADGLGAYLLDAGTLGGGTIYLDGTKNFIPTLRGSLMLKPLPLLKGTGTLELQTVLAGTLAAPTALANVKGQQISLYSVTADKLDGQVAYTGGQLSATLQQNGATVATWQDKSKTIKLSGLSLSAVGSQLKIDGLLGLNSTANLSANLNADLDIEATGNIAGQAKASYHARALDLKGSLTLPQKLKAEVDIQADPFTGWHGGADLTGGPNGVLTKDGAFRLAGPFAYPRLTGTVGLIGAEARLVATPKAVQLRLVSGPQTQASGVLELHPNNNGAFEWSGTAELSRPELALKVSATGPLADPQFDLNVRRGQWRASGLASLKSADLYLTDGIKKGSFTWKDGLISANLPSLNLAQLELKGLGGIFTAQGDLKVDEQQGQVQFNITGLQTPYNIPYLKVKVTGGLTGEVVLERGKPKILAIAKLPSGELKVVANQGDKLWKGQVTGILNQAKGSLAVDISAGAEGLTGKVNVKKYDITALGQTLAMDGVIQLLGQEFEANLSANNTIGAASVVASGGFADLVPALKSVIAVKPTGRGYSLQADLADLEISKLKLAQQLSGQVSGQININDGGGTFLLRSAGIKLGEDVLPVRFEGTQVGQDWRVRGFIASSDITAGLTDGEIFGRWNLSALPVGAVIGAITGTTPGKALVTGFLGFRAPLANPLAGTATLLAERIQVSSINGTGKSAYKETLNGMGTIDFADGEFRKVDIKLAGAGTWDIQGHYTRQDVDLQATFDNTTFTPVLQLIPNLSSLSPTLKGSLTVNVAGTYQRPRGVLRAQNLTGSLAGLSLEVPMFAGDLPDSGAFTGGGQVKTGGTLGADGDIDIKGQLTLGKLSDTILTFGGLLSPQPLGDLPHSVVVLKQLEDKWALNAQSLSETPSSGVGKLVVTGDLTPKWNFDVVAQNYNLPLKIIYGRESALNANLKVVDDGVNIRVSGAAEFQKLLLGRVDSTPTIPAPEQANNNSTGRTTDNYASPLPTQYTTFPVIDETGKEVKQSRAFLDRIVIDNIPIRAPNGIRIDENIMRAEFSGDLLASGTAAKPKLNGEIKAQRGFVYLRENEFAIQKGDIIFSGDGLYPKFNISATSFVPTTSTGIEIVNQRVPITLTLTGDFLADASGRTAINLKTTLFCTVQDASCSSSATTIVPYTELELYAIVVTGMTNLTTLSSSLNALGVSAVQSALNIFVLGEFERTLAKALGVDVLRFTPQLFNTDGTLGGYFSVGTRLSNNFYLQYQVDLRGQSVINATYNTDDNKLTFKVSAPIQGLDLQSITPSFSAAYNFNKLTSTSLGFQSSTTSYKINFGISYNFGTK